MDPGLNKNSLETIKVALSKQESIAEDTRTGFATTKPEPLAAAGCRYASSRRLTLAPLFPRAETAPSAGLQKAPKRLFSHFAARFLNP